MTIKRAKVESKPPEIPMTAFLRFVCSKRLARAADCMFNISKEFSSLKLLLLGTNGCLSINV